MKRVEIPTVGENDVMIKIHKTAICGTDVHIWDWNEWAQNTFRVGTTAGHEYVGEIVEMGSSVQGHHIGELVSATAAPAGGTCAKIPLASASTATAHLRSIWSFQPPT